LFQFIIVVIMKKTILMLIIFITAINFAFSQSKNNEIPFNMGIYGGLNFNFHNPNFTYGVYDINNQFVGNMIHNKNTNSLGGNFGFIANIPLSNMFYISGRLGYNMMNGTLDDDSISTNQTKASLAYLEISPILQIHNLIENQGLYLLAGLELGVPLTKSYEFNYLAANNNTYIGDKTDIPDAATRVALVVGTGWMFDLGSNVFLSPEVSFRIPFSKVSSNAMFDKWEIPQLRAGINLTFGFSKDKPEPIIENDKYINVGMKDITGLDLQGKRIPANKIRVEETQYTELFPIIPYVFFDENKAEPNTRTQKLNASREAGSFSIEGLEPDAIIINSNTLDIIGVRMQQDKNASIKLIGTIDNKNEKSTSDLAKRRAEFAKNYLVVNYGIEGNKITTEAAGLPSKPSSTKDKDGIEENRRVEIVPQNINSTLLKPIVIESDRQRLANPPIVQFTPSVEVSDGLEIESWELEIKQSGRTLKTYSGFGSPDSIQWNISPNELASNEIPAEYNITIFAKDGTKGNYSSSIPVEFLSISKKKETQSADKSVAKFSLVLFDFDSPEVSELDKRIIDQYVIPAIKFNSTVQIYGYADRIGAEDYNKKLSMQRAESVRKILQSKLKDVKYEVYGVGESVQPFDNNLTIGRQLSRTVQIYVITPTK